MEFSASISLCFGEIEGIPLVIAKEKEIEAT